MQSSRLGQGARFYQPAPICQSESNIPCVDDEASQTARLDKTAVTTDAPSAAKGRVTVSK